MEPALTGIGSALQLPIGRPNSLEPYWSITMIPQSRWKKLTTSAFSGSPQLLALRTRTGCRRRTSSGSAMMLRSSVGVVARLVTASLDR
jgi:hypothetical protein